MSDFPSDYAPDPALDFTGLGGVEGDAAGLQPGQEDEEGAAEEMAEGLGVSWMEAFGAEMDWAARARVQTPRSQWTGRDYSDLGVAEAFAEEMAEQAAEAAAEAEAAQAVTEAVEAEEVCGRLRQVRLSYVSVCSACCSGVLAGRVSSGCSSRGVCGHSACTHSGGTWRREQGSSR